MNADRLLLLADRLDAIPSERFNFATWVGSNPEDLAGLTCGTTACAIGHAATMPEFQELGLQLIKNRFGDVVPCLAEDEASVRAIDLFSMEAVARACAKIFGIDYRETEYLFTPSAEYDPEEESFFDRPDDHATPQDVAEHIRRFVKEGGCP